MTGASQWPVTIVESPFGDDTPQIDKAKNTLYAIQACYDCLKKQEVPYASHLFFPRFLKPSQRELGITAGYAMWFIAMKIAFYVDRGWSPGMECAHKRAKELGFLIEIRSLEQKC